MSYLQTVGWINFQRVTTVKDFQPEFLPFLLFNFPEKSQRCRARWPLVAFSPLHFMVDLFLENHLTVTGSNTLKF